MTPLNTTPSAGGRVHLPDPAGLICGFVLHEGDAPPEPLHACPDSARFDAATLREQLGGPVWVHLNLADNRARKWLSACPALPASAQSLLLDEDHHIRLIRAGRGIAAVLGDLHYEFESDPDGLGVLRLYVDDACLITCRRHALKGVDRLRDEIRHGLPMPTPMRLVSHLLEDMADLFGGVVHDVGDRVDDIEDQILKGRLDNDAADLGRVRRLLARLRRHVSADRQVLARNVGCLPDWCGEADTASFRRAIEQLDVVGQDLDLVQERARLLQDEIASRIGAATNRNLYVLSVATVIFMPITLITGIFGMNVGGLPWLESGSGFWIVMVLLFATVLLSLLLLHWRRFF